MDAEVILAEGSNWLVRAERALRDVGARTSRIYLDEGHDASDDLFRGPDIQNAKS